MTQEDITCMAQEAGIKPQYTRPQDSIVRNGLALSGELKGYRADIQDLERFAALVAAAEREACAALCEARFTGDLTREDMEAKRCAEAIRARGQS